MREHLPSQVHLPLEGILRHEREALTIFKTTKEKVPQLRAFLEKKRPTKRPGLSM